MTGDARRQRGTTFGQLHHQLVEQYSPPSVLVNQELDVVHSSEHAGEYLTMADGEPTRHLLRLAHPALRRELQTAIDAARQSLRSEHRLVRFADEHGPRAVELRVRSVDSPDARGMLLIVFDEVSLLDVVAALPADLQLEPIVRDLEHDLRRTRDQLRVTIEQNETAVEELKAANEELQTINEELRSTTEEVTRATATELAAIEARAISERTLAATLREADGRKDDFLATLSHELRNPLTPLRVALDVTRLAKNDSAMRDHALGIMDRQLEVLVRLLDDLLDLSRIARGKLELRLADIDPLRAIELAVETVKPAIDEAGQTLHIALLDTPVLVAGDLTRLAQVVTNLLTNASRYTANGGTIWLEVTADHARTRLAIRVRDNGQGIASDLLPHVFEMYFQSRDELGKSQRGLGVGLNLVQRIVELHGGTVSARSDGPGHGSELVVELPMLASVRS
jgi:signal transduction histidine kinase